ncbi:MAG: DNA-binding response regulator [Chloroflexota bacterium]|nr:MAG: DNA-binding response regulator [Chloroflexota bacterium]
MHKIKVFLAEDHAVVREGLKLLVNSQPDMTVVGEAGDGRSAWQHAIETKAEVVVMDVTMPELNGVEATRLLRENAPTIKVLALTVHEDKGYLRKLLELGASGYVLKKAAADDLISAIRTVASGGMYLDPAMAGRVVSSMLENPNGTGPVESHLSQREAEVVKLIAQGYSNKEIALQLEISVKTVETYKYRVMEKLSLNSRADLVRYALQQGWLQEP